MSQIPSAPHPPPAVELPGFSVPPPVPGRAPGTVRVAVVLVWVLLGLALAELSVTFSADGWNIVTLVGVTVLVLAYCALLAVVALRLRAGHAWPRTVLVVVAVLSAVATALSLGLGIVARADPDLAFLGSGGMVDGMGVSLRLVGLGVFVAAIGLLHHPASRAWLEACREVRSDAARRRVAW